MTDYLRFIFHTFDLYAPVMPILTRVVEKTKTPQFVDLCSGSGGAIERIQKNLMTRYNLNIKFILTDRFPPIQVYKYIEQQTKGAVSYFPFSVLAEQVPRNLTGFRILFSGIHHFEPEDLIAVMRNAADAGEGIAMFDGGNRTLWMMLLILLFHPVALALFTPLIKPFRWSRLVFTYFIPLIPIGTVWDGIVSINNLYKPSELLSMAKTSGITSFNWEAGKIKNKYGLSITYLLGIPEKYN